jgi:hypothetical protein
LRSQDEIRRGNASQPHQSKLNSVAGPKDKYVVRESHNYQPAV